MAYKIPSDMIEDRATGQTVASQLAEKAKQIDNISIDITTPPYNANINSTDNTIAIQNALNYLKSRGGGVVLIPSGTFIVTNLKIPSYCGIKGTGRTSILKAKNSSNLSVIELETPDTKFTYLSDFSIEGNKQNQTSANAKGIYYNGTTSGSHEPVLDEWDARHILQNIYIRETKGNGFEIHGRGESQIHNIQVQESDEYGVYFNSFDNWVSNLSSGSNLKTGIVIASGGGASRFINCKSWNNGRGATQIEDAYGYKLIGVQGLIMSGCDAQANLNHGVYMDDVRGCFINVNSELNGTRNGVLVTPNSSGFYLNGGMFNNIQGTCRNIRNVEQVQDYALTLAGTASNNVVNITAMAMNLGTLNDTNNRTPSNNIKITGDKADYTDVSLRAERHEYIGIGTQANKTISPFWVVSNASDGSYGSLIQRLTTDSTVNTHLMTLEGKNGGTSKKLDIKAHINNNQIIFETNGSEARFNSNLKTGTKVIATAGLGVGNSVSASTLGTLTKKMEVFDANGTSIGFVPIYSSIT